MSQVASAIFATLKERRHATAYPNVYPCAKFPIKSAFRRGRNGVSHEFEANPDQQRDVPASPRFSSCHATPGRTARELTRAEAQPHRGIPSAAMFKIPCTWFRSNCQPEANFINNTRRRCINAPDIFSFPPRQRRTPSGTAPLSPRNTTLPPVKDGVLPHRERRGSM